MWITRARTKPAICSNDARTRPAAALVAIAVGACSLIGGLAPEAASAATATPVVSVSKTVEIDVAGEPITVNGTGFDPLSNIGTRPPLSGQPAGFYVVFGRFADPWKPSEGAPSSARQIIAQRWALPAASRAILDPAGTSDSFVTINTDGTFTATLDVAPADGTGTYGVATYPASGAVNATQETLTAISFAAEPPPGNGETTATGPNGQTLNVTPVTNLNADGQDLVVTGAGYDDTLGIYVALCVDQGPGAAPSPCVGGADQSGDATSAAWISSNPPDYAADLATPYGPGGTFSVQLTVKAADDYVDCYAAGTHCVLASRADHTATANRTADVKVPVYFTGQQPPANPEPVPETDATVDKTEVHPGDELTATGDGLIPGEQVQVWMHSTPQLLAVVVADASGTVTHTFNVPTDAEAGAHHIELYGVTSNVRLVSDEFTVLAAEIANASPTATPTTATTGTLPVTGSGLTLALVALLLIAAGVALVVATPGRSRAYRRGRVRFNS